MGVDNEEDENKWKDPGEEPLAGSGVRAPGTWRYIPGRRSGPPGRKFTDS